MSVTSKALGNVGEIIEDWSPFRPLVEEEHLIFYKAMEDFDGVGYKPQLVSTQVVSGIHYRFECEAQVVYPSAAPIEHALVEIDKPLEGKSRIVNITIENEHASNTESLSDGWSSWEPLTPDSLAVFETATFGFFGVKYTPLEVSTQSVAGISYRFICEAKVLSPDSQAYKMMMEIFKPLKGGPIITNIGTMT